MAKTPSYANATIRVLRLLMEHGRREGWIAINPAARPKLAGVDPSGLVWPRDAVDLFVETADRMGRHSIGTAVLLDEWIGQRQGDVLRLPRSIWRDGSLAIRQSKGGVGVSLPIDLVPRLKSRLEAELARQAARQAPGTLAPVQLIISEETGLPYKADNFRHLFSTIRAAAAEKWPSFEVDHLLPGRAMEAPDAFTVHFRDLQFMHLRHTAVTRLAEADCDPQLIAAVTGHSYRSVLQILERYLVRTRKLARIAFTKRLEAEGGAAAQPAGKERADG